MKSAVVAAATLFLAGGLRAQGPDQAAPRAAAGCPDLAQFQAKLEPLARRLADWPDLARYRAANARTAAPAEDEPRVVFLGDSITENWTAPGSGGFFPGRPYIGRGIGGQTTPQMLVRFRPDVIALRPKAVVILAGTNDLAENTGPATTGEIEGNIASMAELARANGIRVVLCSLLPTGEIPGAPAKRSPERIAELNAWIKGYAFGNGHAYLDYHSAMADARGRLRKELSADGLHPNAAGYAVMAPLAEAAIREALGAKPAVPAAGPRRD